VKPSLSWAQQAELLQSRGLGMQSREQCARFLAQNNYYRFSGYARYFQVAPHQGDNRYLPDATFEEVRRVYEADRELTEALLAGLGLAEILLRSHVAHVIAMAYGPSGHYLDAAFYSGQGLTGQDSPAEACRRDINRSKERYVLRHRKLGDRLLEQELPVWAAVETLSFGTLSKVLERGALGLMADDVASCLGVARAGFAYRVRSLVYLRNRCAHQARLWNHSVIDAGPTPNNVRNKAKRLAGQFEPRSILDVVASMDDILQRAGVVDPLMPWLVEHWKDTPHHWQGMTHPVNARDAGT